MDRETRALLALKQRKIGVTSRVGVPKLTELEDGVPQFRVTNKGLQQFIRIKNELYSSSYTLHTSEISDSLSLTENGYIRFANGMIMQWGKETSTNSTEIVTFPLRFPNACLNVMITDYGSTDVDGLESASAIKTLATRTGLEVSCYTNGTAFFWQAIGN